MYEINQHGYVTVNPAYKFRSDITSVIITNEDSLFFNVFDRNEQVQSGFAWKTHPLIAYLFSFFDGSRSLKDSIALLSEHSGISLEDLKSAVEPFIMNKESMVFSMCNYNNSFALPRNFLTFVEPGIKKRELLDGIDIVSMSKKFDASSRRLMVPNEIMLMLNNTCFTNCIYCYADRTHGIECMLPFHRIVSLIEEAKKLKIRSVEITGGDLFTYPHWSEIIQLLITNNYHPLISTKVALNEESIIKLKNLGVKKIQISLDTLDKSLLTKILGVKSKYLEQLILTFNNLEKIQIPFRIKTVITKYNQEVDHIKKLIEFASRYKYIDEVLISPGTFSLHKPFDSYAASKKKLEDIRNFIDTIYDQYPFKINMRPITISNRNLPFQKRMENFNQRTHCTGNLSSMCILPDGKVTLCEQLYWHPFFLLGDCTNNSIMEVWHSEKALSLWDFDQVQVNLKSPCKTCTTFLSCRRGIGNCWKNAINAYGKENVDFPDYVCPKAPNVFNNVFHR